MLKKLLSYFLLVFSVLVFAKANNCCIAINTSFAKQEASFLKTSIKSFDKNFAALNYFFESIVFEETEEEEEAEEIYKTKTKKSYFKDAIVYKIYSSQSKEYFFAKYSSKKIQPYNKLYILNSVFRI